MLFAFSPNGLDLNWLNPTIIGIIRVGFSSIDSGGLPIDWPNCVPPSQRERLKSHFGFRGKLTTLWQAYRALTADQKTVLKDAIEEQTNLPAVLGNDEPCTAISGLPSDMRHAVDDIFRYMFDLLASCKENGKFIRDIHYSFIYNALSEKLCPYCGLNYFRAPGAPRHALDHFMPISLYPFVGADLRNLPPMCDECNTHFKRVSDVLFDSQGRRRRCSDPYAGPTYHIRLASSVLFAGNVKSGYRLPRWQIDFVGAPPEQAETWDEVYKIRERYTRDILDENFLSWVQHFAAFFINRNGRGRTAFEVAGELPRYIDDIIQYRIADRAFLKLEAFRLIHAGCESPNQGHDVRQWLWNFVEYSV